jgi:hypothetical protein
VADTGPAGNDAASVCASGGARVFVTSAMFAGDLGGIAGADQSCTSAAAAAGIGGTWNAWLSDSTTSALNHIYKTPGPAGYVLLSGATVANDWSSLVSKITPLQHPIDVTETGTTVTSGFEVWTGTDLTGISPQGYCASPGKGDWASFSNAAATPFVGLTNSTSPTWTDVYMQYCDRTTERLYCFERCQ